MTGKRHFTLIELLVVIAIIAILASMLLPSLRQAQERGKSATCQSNQRQIATALSLYSDQNDEWYPPLSINDWAWPFWVDLVEDVLPDARPGFTSGYNNECLTCPTETVRHSIADYGANSYVMSCIWSSHALDWRRLRSVKHVVHPGERLLVCDARETSNAGVLMSSWFLSSAFITSGTAVGALQGIPYPPRHYGGTNLLFCDGHVQWLNHSVLLNDRAELYGASGL